jgi:hypothetical protein
MTIVLTQDAAERLPTIIPPVVSGDGALDWLLTSKDPSVRYLTLTEVLAASPRSRVAREARAAIPAGPRVRALLKGQRRDGGFGVHPYSKWRGAFWRLVSLVELAIPPHHPKALAALEEVLAWLTSPERKRSIRAVNGLVRQHATGEGYALAVACRLGVVRDSRVRSLVRSILRSQWPDGGWNCDPRPTVTHSSFHETIGPLWGLVEYTKATEDHTAREAADRPAEFFLAHRLFRSHRTGQVSHPEYTKLHYPTYWHYDVLWGLLVLSRFEKLGDPRATEALDLLEAKRGRDGRWGVDGRPYWRAPGSEGSNVEVVDWRGGGAKEMVTLNVLRVLRAAGRLHL